MHSLFVRITAFLLLTLVIGLALLIYVGVSSYTDQLLQRHAKETTRAHAVLVRDLQVTPKTGWPKSIARVESFLDYQIDFVDVGNDMESPIINHTSSTFRGDTVEALHAISEGDSNWIRYAHTYESSYGLDDILLLALLFVATPLVLFFTLRPIARKITDLSQVARAYADGKLDERSLLSAPVPLEELASDLHGMAMALQRKIQEQQVMTHAISHELKTPLTRLRMANDLALRENTPGSARAYLEESDEDLTMLEKIMAETLTLSRLSFQGEPLALTAIALLDVIKEVTDECPTQGRALEVDVPLDSTVLATRDAVKRVFSNLLVNAIRYSKHRIRISTQVQGNQSLTTIEDDGAGINFEDREKVFMPFGRAEKGRSRITGDTGMGLAIAALLVQKCNGRIWVDDSPIGGARFYVSLPVPPAE
ncbi:MAG: signal transduction histidine kinase [Congregibacter sp.]|jgi:signal transduction histidine kinase